MNNRLRQYSVYVLVLLGVFLVFYFSWLPDPNIGLKSYFPKWLGIWINANGNIRTAVPFLVLGSILELGFVQVGGRWQKRIIIIVSLIIIVLIAESGQLLLPKRHFDIEDIAWGISGSIIGILLAILGKPGLGR